LDLDGNRAVGCGVIAELTVEIPTPALRPIVDHSTSVALTGTDGRDARCEAHNLNGNGTGTRCGTIAELAAGILTPALHPAGNHGAAVASSNSDGGDARCEAHNLNGSRAVRAGVIAELVGPIAAPALRPTVNHSAGVARSSSDGRDASTRAKVLDLNWNWADPEQGTTEVIVVIGTSALRPTVDHSAGVPFASGDSSHIRREALNLNGNGAVGCGVVA
jgi:hypothetical protein